MNEIDSLATFNNDYDSFVKAIRAKNVRLIKESLQLINSYEELFLNKYNSRKKEGVYFTNEEISDFIIKRALINIMNKKLKEQGILKQDIHEIEDLYSLNSNLKLKLIELLLNLTVCDPTCGSGVFLIGYAKILFNILIKLDLNIDKNKTKINIIHKLFGFDINEFTLKLCIMKLYAWSLTEDEINLSERFKTLNDNLQLKNSIITPIKAKFDVIIGNPPYGNILSKEEKQILKKEDIFHHDIYCAFLLKALNWSIGTIGFLIPKSFLLRQSYIEFRNTLFSKANLLEIYDIGSKLFKKATNEVQIIIYEIKNGGTNQYLKIYDYPDKEIISYENQNVDSLNICYNLKCPLSNNSKKLYVYTFEKKCPHCASKTVEINRIRIKPAKEILQIIKKIEKNGDLNYLNPKDFPKMIRGEEDKGLKQVREKLMKNTSGSCLFIGAKDDFKHYHLKKNKSFVIEEINADALKGENYEYYTNPKLLIKHNNIIPEAIFIKDKVCFTSSIYSLLHKDNKELKYLCALLNSALIQFYCKYGINNQKDTTINLNQYMIRHLPIIKPDDSVRSDISKRVTKIINNMEENNGVLSKDIKDLIREVDDMIFNLYSITEQERNMILANIKNSIYS
jgi:predicted RNA methylase